MLGQNRLSSVKFYLGSGHFVSRLSRPLYRSTLLDEATSSFVVVHRLSTVRRADQILVLIDSEIVAGGRHEGLLAQRGAYYWNTSARSSRILRAVMDRRDDRHAGDQRRLP